jgi:hypothetical protein
MGGFAAEGFRGFGWCDGVGVVRCAMADARR